MLPFLTPRARCATLLPGLVFAVSAITAAPVPQSRPATAPAWTVEPADTAALQGAPAFLSAAAAGTGPFTYQWRKGGRPIDGATSPVLRLKGVQAGDAGDYTLAATGPGGSVTSRAAMLTVVPPATQPAPQLPAIPDKVFSILEYGGSADGLTDNAPAIQRAVAAATAAGGGIVQIPAAAKPYLAGPITLASKINLEVDAGATLRMLPYGAGGGPGVFPLAGNAYANFISATNLRDIALTGGGTIDGQGQAWWAAFNANKTMPHRPFMVRFTNCTNVLLSGVTLADSPMFHAALSNIAQLTVFGLTVRAPATAPNTDGVDPSGAHQLIQGCNISVGDDNIAVKPGSAFSGDLTIADCVFGTGHGVSIGGQTNRGLDGMTVKHCTFDGTTSGLRMKADPTQGGAVKNCTFDELTMTNVQYPIVFYSYYNKVGNPGAIGGNQYTPDKAQAWNAAPPNPLTTATLPSWKNITIRNLTATQTKGFSIIWGLPLDSYFIDTVTLDHVRISGGPGFELYNAANVQFTGGTDVGKLLTCNALAITGQPQSQSVPAGGTAAFTVAYAGGSGVKQTTPAYQWSFNGQPLADGVSAAGGTISGAQTPSLKLTGVRAAQAGAYRVKVFAPLDSFDTVAQALVPGKTPVSATSSPATLTVSGP